eukprot:TRINITY_DN16936_c0_g1_i1.p1 TRINITY_DN16936_c0_g1~~TRINITY_DN16936_c0_g1_i1.p1  ORF type:complete len:148 (-),score=7.56 TRINITY_DN16936_c0_g1_i1:601-1044(-)
MISCKDPTAYDYPLLVDDIIKTLPKVKQDLIALVSVGYSRELVRAKTRLLQGSAMAMAMAVGAVPIVGLSTSVDIAMLTSFISCLHRSNSQLVSLLPALPCTFPGDGSNHAGSVVWGFGGGTVALTVTYVVVYLFRIKVEGMINLSL